MRAPALLLLLAACHRPPCADGERLRDDGTCAPLEPDPSPDSAGHSDPGDSAQDTSITWVTLPALCEAPSGLQDDPLQLSGQDKHGQVTAGDGWFTELIDLELLGEGRIAGVGQGGLMIYDISDPTAPSLLGRFPADQDYARFHRVEALGAGLLAVTHRDHGLRIVDASDPTDIRLLWELRRRGLEGLAFSGRHLYGTDRAQGLISWDVSDPAAPVEGSATPGLRSPWELSPVVEGWTYVADNVLGVVPVDLSDPARPVLGTAVALPGPTQHIAVAGDWLYAAIGSAGVAALDRSAPGAPVLRSVTPVGGSATQVSVVDGVLFVVDHEGLAALSLADPSAPSPLAYEVTPQFALAVRGLSRTEAWVGDWNILSGWVLDPEAQVGELDPSSDELRLPEGGGEARLSVTNRGAGTLTLSGATVDDPSVVVEVSTPTLASGEQGWVRLSWPGGQALSSTLCLASDDPDGPVRQIPLSSGPAGEYLGQPAPDFALTDLDGQTWHLAEELGHPVLLAYFATW